MAAASETPVWYRIYVLLVLLLVCVCNLATRNLPSYLITVPVPDCEAICAGLATNPLCGRNKIESYPAGRDPTRLEACQLCRSRVLRGPNKAQAKAESVGGGGGPAQAFPVRKLTSLHEPQFAEGAPLIQERASLGGSYGHRSLLQAWPDSFALTLAEAPLGAMVEDGGGLVPWSESLGQDASFYNLADGACLYHWEYGLLIGYGFAIVFAVGTVPAGYVCDRKPRVNVVSAALVAWSVATAMQASAHNFVFLLGCRAVIGLAQAFAMPACIAIASDYFTERQNTAVAVLSIGQHLGSGCASFSILFAELLGWRWAVLLAGLFGIAVAPVLYHTVQEPERTEFTAPCSIQVVTNEVFEKSRVARMLIVAASAKMLAAFSLGAFLPIWYSRRGLIGYTNNAYACWNVLIVSAGGLLSAVIGSSLGYYWSQIDPRAPCWIGLLGAIFSLPLLCVVLLTSYFGVSMFCLFLLLLVSESWFGPSTALLQASVRRSVRGQAVSMFMVASTLVANLGPAFVGFLDTGGEGIGVHLLWICLTANIVAAAAFVWTALEIGVDPVAAGLGNKPEDTYHDGRGTRAGTACWAHF